MVNEKRGLPSFFMTGSCAEFYIPPLRRLLEQYILQTTGEEVNLAEDNNSRFKAVQENTHVVVKYFDLRTQSYHEKVLKPMFGSLIIGTAMNLPSLGVKFIGTSSAGEMTGSHTSCYMKLVNMVVMMRSMQLD